MKLIHRDQHEEIKKILSDDLYAAARDTRRLKLLGSEGPGELQRYLGIYRKVFGACALITLVMVIFFQGVLADILVIAGQPSKTISLGDAILGYGFFFLLCLGVAFSVVFKIKLDARQRNYQMDLESPCSDARAALMVALAYATEHALRGRGFAYEGGEPWRLEFDLPEGTLELRWRDASGDHDAGVMVAVPGLDEPLFLAAATLSPRTLAASLSPTLGLSANDRALSPRAELRGVSMVKASPKVNGEQPAALTIETTERVEVHFTARDRERRRVVVGVGLAAMGLCGGLTALSMAASQNITVACLFAIPVLVSPALAVLFKAREAIQNVRLHGELPLVERHALDAEGGLSLEGSPHIIDLTRPLHVSLSRAPGAGYTGSGAGEDVWAPFAASAAAEAGRGGPSRLVELTLRARDSGARLRFAASLDPERGASIELPEMVIQGAVVPPETFVALWDAVAWYQQAQGQVVDWSVELPE